MRKRDEVLALVGESPATPQEVSAITGICVSTVYRYLAEGVAQGLLTRRALPHPGGRKGRTAVLYSAAA